MKRGRIGFNIIDLLIVLFFALVAALLIVFTAPVGKTVRISYTIAVSEGDTETLEINDTLINLPGGCLGTVTGKGKGYVEVETDATYRAGVWYSGAAALKDGREYEFCSGTDRFRGELHRITEN